MNRIPNYVFFVIMLLAGTLTIGAICLFQNLEWHAERSKLTSEVERIKINQATLATNRKRLAEMNDAGNKYVEYTRLWTGRRATYDSVVKVKEIMRAVSSELNVTVLPDGDKVTDVAMDKAFRCEFTVAGKAALLVRWIDEIESRIDLMKLDSMSWRIRPDGSLELNCTYVIKFP